MNVCVRVYLRARVCEDVFTAETPSKRVLNPVLFVRRTQIPFLLSTRPSAPLPVLLLKVESAGRGCLEGGGGRVSLEAEPTWLEAGERGRERGLGG